MRNGTGAVSSAQYRMWLSDELGADRVSNHVPVLYRASSPVQVSGLEAALNRLIERHDALRTTVALGPDGLEPRPGRDSVRVVHEDFRERPGDDPRAVLDDVVHQAFDLERGPLLRAAVVDVASGDHLILLVFHHICIDDWSLRLALGEVWQDYTAQVQGRPVPVPEPSSYRRYADREQVWLESGEAAALLAAAVRDLTRYQGRVRLGTASLPAGAAPAGRGRLVEAVIGAEELGAVEDYGRRARCSLFTVLLALYAVQMRRISRQSRFLIMVPVANRLSVEDQQMVGLFTNIAPVAVDFEFAVPVTFPLFLSRLRRAVLDSIDRQQLPFDRCAAQLAEGGDGRSFGNVSFGMGEAYEEEPAPGVRYTPFAHYVPVRYELAGYVTLGPAGASLSLFHDIDRLSGDDVHGWMNSWKRLIIGLAQGEEPDLA